MRSTLFRGRRIDNGEWCFGLLIRDYLSEIAGICTYAKLPPRELFINVLTNCQIYQVDPETVGQSTSFTDRGHERIFEGDILENCGARYAVEWCKESGMFILPCVTNECLGTDFDTTDSKLFKIIGNIHNNPELLKKEAHKQWAIY